MAVVSHFIDKEFKVGLKVLLSVSFRLYDMNFRVGKDGIDLVLYF